ncbi:DUF6612 family protein [Sporosarcina limicola]|uniref:Copper amine oxidase-like N-terminal domain-containing protein n=1 Tax=Sporosarcina limicola TaxID=34101 RepID=A0A927ML75_9BACL|nr:DUF6612 family protein [Sporosarcina limicola]MBE1556643.1 hypothetical protein [Sporosarcina limicola]
MKKFTSWIFALVLLFSLAMPTGTTFASTDSVKVLVDGVEVAGYEQPFMSHGQVLIPVENLFTEAGYKVSKEKDGTVSVTNTHLTVDFNTNASEIKVNGKKADTEFPLTLRNAGNYISSEFLATLDGFEVKLSEDQKTVNVKTNRVKDVDAFLEKMLAVELKSYSTKMVLDQKMETSGELGSMDMFMEMNMDIIQEPIAMYMLSKMSMKVAGETDNQTSETYFTKDGYFLKDETLNTWVKFDDSLTAGLLQVSQAQANPLAQLELMKKFVKGINIFEYEDVYVMTQTLSTEDYGAMMDEAMSMLMGLLPDGVTTEEVTVEGKVEGIKVEDVKKEETKVDATKTEEATKEEEEEATIEDLEGIFDAMKIEVKEFYMVTTIDKKKLFPLSTTGNINLTMGMDDETISIKQTIDGTFSNHNAVKEIKVPAEALTKAISMEEYMKALEAAAEKTVADAKKK